MNTTALKNESRQAAERAIAALRERGIEPRSLCADSRAVSHGDIFVAYPGSRSDGRRYIADAIARGAIAVLYEQENADVKEHASAVKVPEIPVPDLHRVSGDIADLVYRQPSSRLWSIGVTGTNGKTSVTQWIAQCLGALGKKCAVIGTLGSGFPGQLQPGPNTTPDAIALQRDLAGFIADGAQACAMEVSSIGLQQGRVDALSFNVAVFTNLTRDHLQEHGSMTAYAEAKRRLFTMAGLSAVVINIDDPFGVDLAKGLADQGIHRIGYSLTESDADCVDELLSAVDLIFADGGLAFLVRDQRIEAPVIGRFNAANVLAVLGVLRAGGISLPDAAAALQNIVPPPGRMQMLVEPGKPLLVVDYAHTPDALEKVLTTLRETAQVRGGRLVCVFGCGGDRDSGKRPQMGQIATRLADVVWLTTDNPRSEDASSIIAAIAVGTGTGAHIEADRAAAIRLATKAAAAVDVVLIAGKGHEPYQEIHGVRYPFSDLEEATRALGAWGRSS